MKKRGSFRSYIKDYRFKGILIKYFLILLSCLIIPTSALNALYGNRLSADTRREILSNNEYALWHNRQAFESNLSAARKLAYMLAENQSLRYLYALGANLTSDTKGELDTYKEIIYAVQQTHGYVDSIYVYMEMADAVITAHNVIATNTLSDRAWLDEYSSGMERRMLTRARGKAEVYPHLISIMYPIYLNLRHCVGMVVINVNVELLGEYMGTGVYRHAEGAPLFFVFAQGEDKPVYTDEFRLLRDEPEELEALSAYRGRTESFSEIASLRDKNYVISGSSSELSGLEYLYTAPMSLYEEQQSGVARLIAITLPVSMAVCLALAALFAKWAYKPIRETRRIIDGSSYVTGERGERLDEMQEIQRAILTAQSENRLLNEEVQERLDRLRDAQLCALQAQINPHFLYNTLEAIRASVIYLTGAENQSSDMILTLAKLMRLSLAGQRYLVTLDEELEHVRLFVKIMDFRYNGEVRVHLDVPEALSREKTIKLTLQPLIENAIEHGLRPKRFHGDVWVRCEKADGLTHIYVSDNGVGMSDEEMLRLRENIGDAEGAHIGLRNVHQRLMLVFGDDFGLTITPAPEGGLCVGMHFTSVD